MLRAEESEFEPMVVQRRIFLLFCATVLTGVLLCTAYLIGRAPSFPLGASQGTGPTDKGTDILISAAHERWVVAFMPKQTLCSTSLRPVLRCGFSPGD
jgi:hypothetical protein